jgi:hypothetical protein
MVREPLSGDEDVQRLGPGVAVDLALLAVQAGLGPGCHILGKTQHLGNFKFFWVKAAGFCENYYYYYSNCLLSFYIINTVWDILYSNTDKINRRPAAGILLVLPLLPPRNLR